MREAGGGGHLRSERGRVERDEKKDPPTQAPPRALSARGAMASWLSAFSSAYLPGDVVPMMRRTQHSGVRVHTEFFFAVSYSHGVPPSPFFLFHSDEPHGTRCRIVHRRAFSRIDAQN